MLAIVCISYWAWAGDGADKLFWRLGVEVGHGLGVGKEGAWAKNVVRVRGGQTSPVVSVDTCIGDAGGCKIGLAR